MYSVVAERNGERLFSLQEKSILYLPLSVQTYPSKTVPVLSSPKTGPPACFTKLSVPKTAFQIFLNKVNKALFKSVEFYA